MNKYENVIVNVMTIMHFLLPIIVLEDALRRFNIELEKAPLHGTT